MKFSHFNGKEPNEELKDFTIPTLIGYKDGYPLYRFTLKLNTDDIDFNDGQYHVLTVPVECGAKAYMYIERVCVISGIYCSDITNYNNPITDINNPTQMNWTLLKPTPPSGVNRSKVRIKAERLFGSKEIPSNAELLITIVMQEH